MTNAVAGVGTVFERWNGTGWDTIAEINSIEGPSMNKDIIEVTSLDTAGGYNEFITGFMDGGQLTLNMNFTRSGYEVMKQDFEIDVARDYRITLPDDEETDIYFEGFVIEIPLTIEAEDKLTVDVTIQVTGEVAVGSGVVESGGASQSWESYWANQDWANYFYKFGDVIYANKETSISYHNPTHNYGAHVACFTGEYNSEVDQKSRILMDFDLTPLDDAIINSVSLNLYLVNNLADNARKIQVFRMKRAWTEGTGTMGTPLTGDGATWNTYDGSNNWTSAGAFDPSDCEQTPIGELELSATERNGYKSIPLSITSKDELTLGYGFLIKMETEENDAHVFYTKEHTTTNKSPYISCSYSKLQNGTVSPLLTKYSSNPLFGGVFGSIVYEGVGQYSYYYCRVANRYVRKRSSTDGLTWGTESNVIDAGLGNYVEVASAWKEGSVWYMLYRSNEWGGSKAIGLATSTDGTTWTKEATNPVITNADIGAWCKGDIDPWGIIKVGSTYYLWVCDVNEIPRQSGLMTSTDLINWTPDANNPIFDNGRYCGTVIKYDGYYYMFMPYTPLDNISGANPAAYRIELYRDSDPRFLATSREYLGNVMLGGEDTEWDDDFLDTPSILTETIQRDTFPLGDAENGKLWMYYTGHSGTVWAHGLAIGHLEMLPKLTALTEPGAGE